MEQMSYRAFVVSRSSSSLLIRCSSSPSSSSRFCFNDRCIRSLRSSIAALLPFQYLVQSPRHRHRIFASSSSSSSSPSSSIMSSSSILSIVPTLWLCLFRPLFYIFIALYLLMLAVRRVLQYRSRHHRQSNGATTVAFFHPFCNSGGGGERVLWQYVRSLQLHAPSVRIVIYTGDVESSDVILAGSFSRFNLTPVPSVPPPTFVRLSHRALLTAERWPVATMFGQSIGSVLVAFESLWLCTPDVFIDTTGYAFTYPLARYIFGASVHCYTHYPTISTDMLDLVYERRPSYNNHGSTVVNPIKARIKWIYYKLFAYCYGHAGRAAQSVFVNSSWTRGHIDNMWGSRAGITHTVYPPCDTRTLQQSPLGSITRVGQAAKKDAREDLIVSIAQFRPEKDHQLQLRAFALFLQKLKSTSKSSSSSSSSSSLSVPKLVLIGGVRDAGDASRVAELRALCDELDIVDHVEFQLNVSFATLQSYLTRATAGLHTMWNEHFGIGVVEFMAAGVIPVAHNSGGPRFDIVVPSHSSSSIGVGFLATTVDDYASALIAIFASPLRGSDDMNKMRIDARARASTFSDQQFESKLKELLIPFVMKQRR